MKFYLLSSVLSALCLMVQCISANTRYLDNKVLLHSQVSPNHAMMLTGYRSPQNIEQANSFMHDSHLNEENGQKICNDEHAIISSDDVNSNVESSTHILNEHSHVLLQQEPTDKTMEESITEVIVLSTSIPQLEENSTQEEELNKPQNQNLQPGSEEDDNTNDSFIPEMKMSRQPPASNFFPIMFGGYDSGMERSEGVPSGNIAIANSFSTGKGGVATSHATAHGDPSESLKHLN